jgi:nucleoside-diphosphate-sugar epimerase
VLQEGLARWRAPRGYVENVAAAIVLAARTSSAAGRIYNVAEPDCCSELEWTLQIAEVVGWTGRIVTVPFDEAPDDARIPGNLDQHWTVDSTRIRRELGYEEPIGRKGALQRTTAWERSASEIQTAG